MAASATFKPCYAVVTRGRMRLEPCLPIEVGWIHGEGIGIAQYLSDPVFLEALEKSPEEDMGAAVGHFLGVFANPGLTWERLEWLRGTIRQRRKASRFSRIVSSEPAPPKR